MKQNISLILILSVASILSIAALILGLLSLNNRFKPFVNGQEVNNSWLVSVEPIIEDGESGSRSKVYLVNKSSGEKYLIYSYLLYFSDNDLFGKVYKVDGKEYFVTRIDNEGSADTLYYSVFKLNDTTVEEISDSSYVWACSDPKLKKDKLVFYGDIFSEDGDCFFLFSNIEGFKRYTETVGLK
jgi:hypothetical protein